MAPIYQPPLPNSDSAFPILTIAVFSIMGTVFLLISYYIFVIKCCSNWHHLHLLRRFSAWLATRNQDPFIAFSPSMWNHGLDESIIREIPTSRFKRSDFGNISNYRCVFCLNQFEELDLLRILPNCHHSFHLDCIDIWFQTNANCPLCRTSISGTTRYPTDQIIAPNTSPQNSDPFTDSLMDDNEDFVVIELGGEHGEVLVQNRQQEKENSREVFVQPRSHSPKKVEKKVGNVRDKDDKFFIQPIRRSFSLDSATDRQLYLTVQAVIKQSRDHHELGSGEECNCRVQRPFFPSPPPRLQICKSLRI